MRVSGMMAMAIVAGGIALGAVLGDAADPKMKGVPEQPWLAALQAPVQADPGYPAPAPWPVDLAAYPDSYAPTWADEVLTDWAPDYPEWTYSDSVDEPFADAYALDSAPADDGSTPAEEMPREPAEVLPPEPRVAGNLAALY